MQVSASIKAKRKSGEGLRLTPYLDPPLNTRGLYSIGYGHQIQPNEKYLMSGITAAKAEQLFDSDCRIHENAVNSALKIPVNQNQFDALWEFSFNTGRAKQAADIWNTTRDSDRVAQYIKTINKVTITKASNGKPAITRVDSGLTAMREFEANLFMGGITALDPKRKAAVLITIAVAFLIVYQLIES